MRTRTIDRRAFLGGLVAAAGTARCSTAGRPAPTGASDTRPWAPPSGGLVQKGVNYDVGIPWAPGFNSRAIWRPDFVRRELTAIRDELRGNSVLLYGFEIDRLAEAAQIAAELELRVWLSPRHVDASPADTLRHLAETAVAAETLRREHDGIGLLLGCELTIFMAGLVPGHGFQERAAALGTAEAAGYDARLGAFLAQARGVARRAFRGSLSYSSGTWENVDWSEFDLVASNLYRDAANEATYRQDLRSLHRHGQAVLITEFGCAAHRGAAEKGPTGHEIIDWTGARPQIRNGHVRDEQVQAGYIDELLGLFAAEHVDGAFVFEFISPSHPYSTDPRYDLDMACYSVVKVHPAGSPRSYESGYWEPKLAFEAIARRFA